MTFTLHFRTCSLFKIKINSGYKKKKKIRRFSFFLVPRGLVYLHLCWLVVKPNAKEDDTMVDISQEWLRKFIPFGPHILFRSTASNQNTYSISAAQCLRLFRLLLFYTTIIFYCPVHPGWPINHLTELLSSSEEEQKG